jgi:hypothetical protein
MMMEPRYYCGVCNRDTTPETPPMHRHIEKYENLALDVVYLRMLEGTEALLTAFMQQQAPEVQIHIDAVQVLPPDLRDMEAFRVRLRNLYHLLGLPAQDHTHLSLYELLGLVEARLRQQPGAAQPERQPWVGLAPTFAYNTASQQG